MEKYLINENLKKEYKTAILNQKDDQKETHTHICFCINITSNFI